MNAHLLPYAPERDIYRLLGVSSTASIGEINAACRRLARTFHPDHNASLRATQEMQVVNAVRRVMTDPEMRALYDRERRRFHAELARPTTSRPAPWEPAAGLAARPAPVGRYTRAFVRGARAALTGLQPRCAGCRAVMDPGDVYCAACGTRRLTGG